MVKAWEFHRLLYICFIDLWKAYDSINREALWSILQSFYHLPVKLISVIQAVHDGSRAAVRAYGRVSVSFDVTCGVCQGCVLEPALLNLYFDVIHMLLDSCRVQNNGLGIAYLHSSKLVGNCKKLQLETLVIDLEYADGMALLADSWNDLEAMLITLFTHCSAFGLSISCSKTKNMAVLPAGLCAPPVPIHLFPNLLTLCPVSSIWEVSSRKTVALTWRSAPGSAKPLKLLAVSVVSSGTRRSSTFRQSFAFSALSSSPHCYMVQNVLCCNCISIACKASSCAVCVLS